MSQKTNINNSIDTHFAFAVLILVTAVFFFTFWIDYEVQKDRELLHRVTNSQQQIVNRINQIEKKRMMQAQEVDMEEVDMDGLTIKEGSKEAMKGGEGLDITEGAQEVLKLQ